MKRSEDFATKNYPIDPTPLGDDNLYFRLACIKGYEGAGDDIIKHCEEMISKYNANNYSNLFLRRAFADVIKFIKEEPYEEPDFSDLD